MGVGICVIVDIRHDFPGRCSESRIPCRSQALIFGCDDSETVGMRDLCSGIRGAIVYHDDFVIRILKSQQTLQAFRKSAAAIKRTHDDRNLRPTELLCKGDLGECFPNSSESGFGTTIPSGDAKRPIVDFGTGPVPLISPRKYKGPCTTGCKGTPELPFERVRLSCLSVAETIETDLAHQ